MGKIITKGQIVFGVAVVALGVVNLFCARFWTHDPRCPLGFGKPIFLLHERSCCCCGRHGHCGRPPFSVDSNAIGVLFLRVCTVPCAAAGSRTSRGLDRVWGSLRSNGLGRFGLDVSANPAPRQFAMGNRMGKGDRRRSLLVCRVLSCFRQHSFLRCAFHCQSDPCLDSGQFVLGLSDRDGFNRIRNQYCHSAAG